MKRFERLLQATQSPIGIIGRLREREAWPEDVEVLLEVYPLLLRQALLDSPDALPELCRVAPLLAERLIAFAATVSESEGSGGDGR